MEMTAYMAILQRVRVFVRKSNLPNDIFNRIKWNKRASQQRREWNEVKRIHWNIWENGAVWIGATLSNRIISANYAMVLIIIMCATDFISFWFHFAFMVSHDFRTHLSTEILTHRWCDCEIHSVPSLRLNRVFRMDSYTTTHWPWEIFHAIALENSSRHRTILSLPHTGTQCALQCILRSIAVYKRIHFLFLLFFSYDFNEFEIKT